MKKLLIVTTIIGSLMSSMAFAKTEGNYVGLDILNTNFESYDSYNEKHDGRDFGLGLNYKHAINFDSFFIAPGVFYNFNNVEISYKDKDGDSYNDKLRYSYGINLDLGYDINDKFATFASVGYVESRINHNAIWSNTQSDLTEESILYGFGVKYSATDLIDVNLSYEYFSYDSADNNLDVDVLKIGASYKF